MLFYHCLSVHQSVCFSVTNLTCKLNISLLLLKYLSFKAEIWYDGTAHQYTSAGIKGKVI